VSIDDYASWASSDNRTAIERGQQPLSESTWCVTAAWVRWTGQQLDKRTLTRTECSTESRVHTARVKCAAFVPDASRLSVACIIHIARSACWHCYLDIPIIQIWRNVVTSRVSARQRVQLLTQRHSSAEYPSSTRRLYGLQLALLMRRFLLPTAVSMDIDRRIRRHRSALIPNRFSQLNFIPYQEASKQRYLGLCDLWLRVTEFCLLFIHSYIWKKS